MAKNDTIHHLIDLYDEEITKDAYGKTIRAKLWDKDYMLMQ